MSNPLAAWLAERRAACRMAVRAIPWRDCGAWHFVRGRLEHVTGGFFAVVGVRSTSTLAGYDGLVQPIIDQPEIGILGFLVRDGGRGREWLVQAKAEPGNVGEVQLAPSVQATRSNYLRLHGGAATPYLGLFEEAIEAGTAAADSLQSEHGSRFLGKYNRNMTVRVARAGPDACSADWRWTPSAELRSMLTEDFAVNTDARSVLFCSDWALLADDAPFSRGRGAEAWATRLFESFAAGAGTDEAPALAWLQAQRARLELAVERMPLPAMPGWDIDDVAIVRRSDGRALICAYDVRANSREVDHWNQPLMPGQGEESVVQLCQRQGGVLRFLFRASAEIGFREKLQLGPTWQSDDPTDGRGSGPAIRAACRAGWVRHVTRQSDEGGRFFRAACRYQIVEVPEDSGLELAADRFLALDLGQVSRLARVQGVFSNEARSALSMLLSEL